VQVFVVRTGVAHAMSRRCGYRTWSARWAAQSGALVLIGKRQETATGRRDAGLPSQVQTSPVPLEVLEHVEAVLVLDRNPSLLAQDGGDNIGV
jgi:hypothetical protein